MLKTTNASVIASAASTSPSRVGRRAARRRISAALTSSASVLSAATTSAAPPSNPLDLKRSWRTGSPVTDEPPVISSTVAARGLDLHRAVEVEVHHLGREAAERGERDPGGQDDEHEDARRRAAATRRSPRPSSQQSATAASAAGQSLVIVPSASTTNAQLERPAPRPGEDQRQADERQRGREEVEVRAHQRARERPAAPTIDQPATGPPAAHAASWVTTAQPSISSDRLVDVAAGQPDRDQRAGRVLEVEVAVGHQPVDHQVLVGPVDVQVAHRRVAERPVARGHQPDGDQRQGREPYAGSGTR